jgi:hypothetical protein
VALILAVLVVLLSADLATAQDATQLAMARVRLTTDPKVPVGCTTLGTVDDDSIRDLRHKVVRLGGDTALLSFPIERVERINAIVFRCPPAAAAAPPPSPPAPGTQTAAPSTLPAVRPAPSASATPSPPAGVPPPPPPPGSAPPPR